MSQIQTQPSESTMQSCLKGLQLRGFRPKHVIDVGASHGPWTSMASCLWPTTRFTMFEPLSEHSEALKSLCQTNRNISQLAFALGGQKTTLPISIYPDHLDAASLAYTGPKSREIPVERLDDLQLSGQVHAADMIKIDVQGFEKAVLTGAELAMKTIEVAIIETYFFRFSPQMMLFDELVGHMKNIGFRVYEIFDPIRRPFDQAFGQCDLCFVRDGHTLLSSNAWHSVSDSP